MGTLYLIPTTLGNSDTDRVIPAYNRDIIKSLTHFFVENIRTARRFLKLIDKNIDIDSLQFYLIDKHSNTTEILSLMEPIYREHSIGVISEAGCPSVADPGADIVGIAHTKGMKVVPLVGPSSIILSLMASGFNGQNFAFNGYLPIDKKERIKKLKQLESKVYSDNQTQIFIETPYRNNQLISDLKDILSPDIKLSIASDITTEEEYIRTLPIKYWKKENINLHKKPTIFLIYK